MNILHMYITVKHVFDHNFYHKQPCKRPNFARFGRVIKFHDSDRLISYSLTLTFVLIHQ